MKASQIGSSPNELRVSIVVYNMPINATVILCLQPRCQRRQPYVSGLYVPSDALMVRALRRGQRMIRYLNLSKSSPPRRYLDKRVLVFACTVPGLSNSSSM